MTQRPSSSTPHLSSPASRRRFLQRLAAIGALAAGGPVISACSERASQVGSEPDPRRAVPPGTPADNAGRLLPGAVDGRVLVVVDFRGGNDGLSTVVPVGDGHYHDLRPQLALPEGDALLLDDRVGLHPNLRRLHRRGLATVEGVGPIDGDLSHFAMTRRWERGDVDGTSTGRNGFLGRLTDALDDGSPLVGASLAGPTPHFVNDRAATLSLSGHNDLWFLSDEWIEAAAFQDGLRALAASRDASAATIGDGYHDLLDLAAQLPDTTTEIDWEQPMIAEGGELGQQLYLAAELVQADVGVRVVYAALDGFDTHDNHGWRHPQLMLEFDAALDGFLERLDDAGWSDRVLVATTSEFGRRVPENGAGLDHGSASTMLLAGPIADERLGEPPPLDDLDADDNLRVTAGFDRYLASLAEEWLGVEAASILPGDPRPLGLLA